MSAPAPLFVLGARDPEMRLIEAVLASLDLPAIGATRGGKRVWPGNAYHADPPALVPAPGQALHAVECRWAGTPAATHRIDHHWPGDPGYGRPPQDYWAAASIGQLFVVLEAWLHAAGRAQDMTALRARFGAEARLAAAADHCLGAALQDRCPGAPAAAVLDWCVRGRARFEKRPAAEVHAEIEASAALIRARAADGLADLRVLPGGTVPEAPLAACLAGVAALTCIVDRAGRRKIGLLGATPEQVRAFLGGALVPGLSGCYGDPARGFAGGYLDADEPQRPPAAE